jgi:hypothetical protein
VNATTELELFIDRDGIQAVLLAVEEVCHGKADDLRSNWLDAAGARAWGRMARAVRRARELADDLVV